MCSECELNEMAGVHIGHLPIVQAMSTINSGMIANIYSALIQNLNPHLPVFTALVAMIEALERKDFGILEEYRLVRLPLSVIGSDKVRYRTEIVEHLHESVLSFRMSEITIETLRTALRPDGLCVLFLCSCGVVMGRCEDVRAYYGSDAHRRMDRLRSAIDAEGNPVVPVASFTDIKVETMDLHHSGAEERLFARIEELTHLAGRAGRTSYDWVGAELNLFIRSANPLAVAA